MQRRIAGLPWKCLRAFHEAETAILVAYERRY